MARLKDLPQRVTNLTSFLVAAGFVVAGIAFLALASLEYAPRHIWLPSLLGQVGGLLVATGLITVSWELFGKRAFAEEVFSKAQLRADLASSGLERVHDSYLEDVEWASLFENSRSLDIVVAYASTWRNTHRNRLESLVAQEGAKLRVFLPDPHDDQTMSVLARRFKTTETALQAKVEEAIVDFRDLERFGNVEIYTRAGDAVFSCYRFDRRAVLTLYSHSQERRTSVPTFLVGDGVLRDFVRTDIDAIKRQSKKI
jgi:hypothetical protein